MTCLSETDCGFTAFLVDRLTWALAHLASAAKKQMAGDVATAIQKWLNQRTADLSADQPSLFPGTALSFAGRQPEFHFRCKPQ